MDPLWRGHLRLARKAWTVRLSPKAYQAVAASFQRGDADTIAALYTDDAELFVPGAPVIQGKRAIRDAWNGIFGTGGNRVAIDVREVQESGDIAFDTGHFTATGPDGSILNTGKWIVIWKRLRNAHPSRDLTHLGCNSG
jgi:uncharacterized protein (TIGR02246 family)